MLQSAGQTFLAALRDVAERQFGRDHQCWRAIDQALADGDAAAAQAALHGLEPAVLERLMAETHKTMREDPARILGAWSSDRRSH